MTFLITGATGSVGRHVVDELVRAGAPVRALTRDPAAADLPEGAQIVRGDLTRPETLAPALRGVTGVHLIDVGGPGYAPLPNGREIVELIRRAGVRKGTLLSGWATGTPAAAVTESDLDWTYVHPPEPTVNAPAGAPSPRASA